VTAILKNGTGRHRDRTRTNERFPPPLVPPEADMRGLQFMPLDVNRLMDSDFVALSKGDEFKAGMALWCKAWLQLPAGSLPDDDRVLAYLSGSGSNWKKVKEMALRGFVKCNDGRLYHPVIAEKVKDAWQMRLRQRERSEKGNKKRWGTSETSPSDPSGDRHGDRHGDPCAIPRDRESDSDRDREVENPTIVDNSHVGLVASKPAPRRAKRAKARNQISEDTQPNEKDRLTATEHGLSGESFRTEWRKFRDHHRAKGSLMADWSAAWRTWCGNIPEFKRQSRRTGGLAVDPQRDGVALLLAECRKRETEDEHNQSSMLGGNVRHLPVVPAERDTAERDSPILPGRSGALF
jgi:hypothetical protein